MNEPKRPLFSRAGFVFATIGSAVGLGNIWKFPYITYENGGGSFVLTYLIAVALIGAPLMMAEIFIGRHSRRNVVDSFKVISKHPNMAGLWKVIGWLSLIGLFFLTYYYSVAGWILFYLKETIKWSFQGFQMSGAELSAEFTGFMANGPMQMLCTIIFLGLTALVISFDLTKGIEKTNKILMPALFGCLIIFIISVSATPGFSKAFSFLFHFGKVSSSGILEAIGHSFFTLSLGAGMGITFGSYLSNKQSIMKSTFMVVFFDTLIGIMACVIMFSIIFSVPEAERAQNFSKSAIILFTTMPGMLYELPGGAFIAPLFYLSVGFAALTSTIAMGEVFLAFMRDRFQWSRKKCASVFFFGSLFIAIPVSLSNGGVKALTEWAPLGESHKGVFGILDYLVSNWFVVISGLLTALFVGWAFPGKPLREEMEEGHGKWKLYPFWRITVRFIIPAGIVWIIIAVLQGVDV